MDIDVSAFAKEDCSQPSICRIFIQDTIAREMDASAK